MHRSLSWRFAAVLIAVVLAASACGNDDDNANYVDIPEVVEDLTSSTRADDVTALQVGGDQVVNTDDTSGDSVEIIELTDQSLAVAVEAPIASLPAGQPLTDLSTFEDIVEAYDRFLEIRSQVILGEANLSALDGLATDAGTAHIATLQSEQDVKIAQDAVSALTGLYEWSNVSAVTVDGDRYRFFDCTERQERNSYGGSRLYFVTNEVTMVATTDGYAVDDVVVRQPGFWAEQPGEFACVPDSLAERAQGVAAAALAEVADIVADPVAAQDRDVSPLIAGELRDLLEDGIDELVESNRYRPADEVVDLDVLGINANSPDLVVVIGVCRTYPNGRAFVDATTDQPLSTDLAPGATEYEWLHVRLQHGFDGSEPDAVVAAEPIGPTC